jgi:hypothetical protein
VFACAKDENRNHTDFTRSPAAAIAIGVVYTFTNKNVQSGHAFARETNLIVVDTLSSLTCSVVNPDNRNSEH